MFAGRLVAASASNGDLPACFAKVTTRENPAPVRAIVMQAVRDCVLRSLRNRSIHVACVLLMPFARKLVLTHSHCVH
jgi:hypothetical protein